VVSTRRREVLERAGELVAAYLDLFATFSAQDGEPDRTGKM
jgi:hypothetical protein